MDGGVPGVTWWSCPWAWGSHVLGLGADGNWGDESGVSLWEGTKGGGRLRRGLEGGEFSG